MQITWTLPAELTSSEALDAVVDLAESVATAIDPSRPPLTPVVTGEWSSEQGSQGQTISTRVDLYGGVVASVTETVARDADTPTSHTYTVTGASLPLHARVAMWLTHGVPTADAPARAGGFLEGGSPDADERVSAVLAAVPWTAQ